MIDAKWLQSVIQVGGGRGFVMADNRENLVIVTAAHCLPHLPPAHGASHPEERTYWGLLGRLGDEPSIAAEVLFVDPVADIAILGTPDNQELWEQAEAYDALVDVPPVPMAALEFRRKKDTLGSQTVLGLPEAEADAWLLALDGEWFPCRVNCRHNIWISNAGRPIMSGMSGSPIVTQTGVIGIVTLSMSSGTGSAVNDHREGGPQAYLPFAFPGWMLLK